MKNSNFSITKKHINQFSLNEAISKILQSFRNYEISYEHQEQIQIENFLK